MNSASLKLPGFCIRASATVRFASHMGCAEQPKTGNPKLRDQGRTDTSRVRDRDRRLERLKKEAPMEGAGEQAIGSRA